MPVRLLADKHGAEVVRPLNLTAAGKEPTVTFRFFAEKRAQMQSALADRENRCAHPGIFGGIGVLPRQAARFGVHGNPTPSDCLDSWKEIAVHLRRTVRTVQRWEKKEGLPVHRHHHQRSSSVYASKLELDSWWKRESEKTEKEVARVRSECPNREVIKSDGSSIVRSGTVRITPALIRLGSRFYYVQELTALEIWVMDEVHCPAIPVTCVLIFIGEAHIPTSSSQRLADGVAPSR